MIKLLDFGRSDISILTNVKDYHIVETLDGNETLYFSLPIEDSQNTNIQLEYYVQNEKNRYVIKEKHSNGDWYDYVCQLDVDDLKKIYSLNDEQPDNLQWYLYWICISAGDGVSGIWSYEYPSDMSNTPLVSIGNDGKQLTIDRLKKVAECFGVELKIDAINKKIITSKQFGSDKGCYFIEDLNLKKLDIDSDTNDLITRLEPIGKDGLSISSINDGLKYVSNNTYTGKIIYGVWPDERYTEVSSLKSAAEAKLSELCHPATTYSADVVDLASATMEYADILSYELGDTVTLFNRKENQKQTHRIVEIDKYPEEPHRNKCQLSSKAYSIIGVQKRSFKSTDSLQGKVGITKSNGDGTVSTAVAGTDYATPTTNLLWSGVKLMNPNTDQDITLSQAVSKQNKGIVLVFSEYNPSTNTVGNSMVSSHFVSKYEVSALSGVGHLFTTFATWGKAMAKYLYITDTTIRGHDANDNAGTATNGLLYDNTCFVLRYVIGV